MKALFIGLIFLLFTQFNIEQSNAQDWGLTLGAGFGTEITSLGFQGGGFYHIREDIRIATDVTYYVPNNKTQLLIVTIDKDWLEFNLNGQFGFIPEDHIFLYSLAGFNYSIAEEVDGKGAVDLGGFGINLGGGFDIKSRYVGFYAEIKYTLLVDQFSGFIGTRLYF